MDAPHQYDLERAPNPTDDTRTRTRDRLVLGACFLAALVALLAHIAAEPLDHGYTRYGAVAEKMVRIGDWVVPWLGDQIYILKPPLQSWLIAIPIAILGKVPNWVTHVPNLIGATASLVATWFLARRLLGSSRGATLATLVLATFDTFVEHARGERVDPLFADSLVTAITFFHAAVTDNGKRTSRELFAMWMSLIVAMLTKPPFGLIFFLAVTVPHAISIGRARLFLARSSVLSAVLALAITAIWPLLLIQRLGWDEVARLLDVSEFTKQSGGPFFYFGALPLSMVPWAIFIPALVVFLVRAKPWRDATRLRLPCIWIGVFVISLHLSAVRHERYLLPVLAPTAILVAAMFQSKDRIVERIARWTGAAACILIALVACGMPMLPVHVFEAPPEFSIRAVGVVVLAGAALLSFVRDRSTLDGALRLGLAFLLTFAVRDRFEAEKLAGMDGRRDASTELGQVLHEHPIYTHASVDYEKLGMIEMILQHDLPRLPAVPDAGAPLFVLLSPIDKALPPDLTRLGKPEVVEKLELDETKFWLVRFDP